MKTRFLIFGGLGLVLAIAVFTFLNGSGSEPPPPVASDIANSMVAPDNPATVTPVTGEGEDEDDRLDAIGRDDPYLSAAVIVDERVGQNCSAEFQCGAVVVVYDDPATAEARYDFAGTPYDASGDTRTSHRAVKGQAFLRIAPDLPVEAATEYRNAFLAYVNPN